MNPWVAVALYFAVGVCFAAPYVTLLRHRHITIDHGTLGDSAYQAAMTRTARYIALLALVWPIFAIALAYGAVCWTWGLIRGLLGRQFMP